MKASRLASLCIAALFALTACEDDDEGVTADASAIVPSDGGEAAPDGPPAIADAAATTADGGGVSMACTDYCSCMSANCPGSFADTAACITACEALAAPDLACRTQHCGFAAGGMGAVHCPHARGESICM